MLVDFETSWYASNTAAFHLLKQGTLRPIVITVICDGHLGPKLIGVEPEFLSFLIDPKQNSAGALFDFGCYGPDLMTWPMDGETPISVTAVTGSLTAPYDDPPHGCSLERIDQEGNILSSLKTNMTVSEILDAARRSAATGKAGSLPLKE